MSQAMRVRPSELAGIRDPWMAYYWDESCYMVSLYDLGKKPEAPKRDDTFGAYG